MTQQLAHLASAGGAMLLLTMVLALTALEGAAGGRSHQPTLVAGPLVHHRLVGLPGRVACDSRRMLARVLQPERASPLGHLRHTR